MRIRTEIYAIVMAFFLPVACVKSGPDGKPAVPAPSSPASGEMDASCSVIQLSDEGPAAGMMTRTVIGQTTAVSLSANFIKLDENPPAGWGSMSTRDDYACTPFQGWSDSQTEILDASIFASPDNTEGIHFRSIVFNPRQTYDYFKYDVDGNPETEEDTVNVGFISRMVGWYPRVFELQTDAQGRPVNTAFNTLTDIYTTIEKDGVTYDCVRFKNRLDGQTDVMMTDMREGRYDLRTFGKGFKNNDSDIDVQPYGHVFHNRRNPDDGYDYCNYFTFNHYLTAVRLFVQADESDLSLISWKQISDVVFTNQPSTVTIALPTVQSRQEGVKSDIIVDNYAEKTLPIEGVEPVFGQALEWTDFRNMPIIRTPMAENDPDHEEFAMTPDYPVSMEHGVELQKEYLGYMLLQPDVETTLELHTDAGIFSATIPVRASYVIENADGTTTEVKDAPILEAGHIYNIVIDIKTDGSLDVVIGNEDFERFRNLAPYNPDIVSNFEYSNCYVVTPQMMKDEDTGSYYDGFYFQAMVAGRGELGVIGSTAGAELYPDDVYFDPYFARILWQDEPYLITHVELLQGYVRFTLNEACRSETDPLTDPLTGNAVIAVYDRAGEIIWSWHIWVTDRLEDVSYALPGSAGIIENFTMLNMNLGATADVAGSADTVLDTYGFYYQWGRKDPSPGPAAYDYAQADLTTAPYYYMDQGVMGSVSAMYVDNPTVELSARNPLAIMGPSIIGDYPNDWLFYQIDRLWGYSGSSVTKTIYDPCPYGYRVADDELKLLFDYCMANQSRWSEVSVNGDPVGVSVPSSVSTASGGGRQRDNFFPFTGWRGHDRGRTDRTHAWFYVGDLADYQDARVNHDENDAKYYRHRGRSLLIQSTLFTNGSFSIQNAGTYSSNLTADYANRTSAAPVRCIKYSDEPSVQNRW